MRLTTAANELSALRSLPRSVAVRDLLAKRRAASVKLCDDVPAGYVRELFRTKLLSPEEERMLFEQMDALKSHAASFRNVTQDIQSAQSVAALAQVEREIEEIRNHLVESNLRLVVSIARKLRSPDTLDYQDLISEGNAILMKAVDLFQVKYGYRFSTYATTALKRGLYNHCNVAYRQRNRFVSGEPDRFDACEDNASEQETFSVDAVNEIHTAMLSLDDRERKIVRERFGLEAGSKGKSFREIGEDFNLSKERVRQIMRGALVKMRSKMESQEMASNSLCGMA